MDGVDDTNTAMLDLESVNAEIIAGARAFEKLLRHAADDWTSWSITIRGFRALRNLAFADAGTNDIRSDAYKKQIGQMLAMRKYVTYSRISKQDRSSIYKLMDCIEDIDVWYATLPTSDKLRWKHPDSIVKHAPKSLLAGGMRRHNIAKKPRAKKPVSNAEIERLKAILIRVIRRLAKYEPDAVELLDEIDPAAASDRVDDLWPAAGAPTGHKSR